MSASLDQQIEAEDRQIEAENRSLQAGSLENDRLASMGTRTGSFLINGLVPNLLGFIPILGIIIWLVWEGFTLSKMRRGQDIGACRRKLATQGLVPRVEGVFCAAH